MLVVVSGYKYSFEFFVKKIDREISNVMNFHFSIDVSLVQKKKYTFLPEKRKKYMQKILH